MYLFYCHLKALSNGVHRVCTLAQNNIITKGMFSAAEGGERILLLQKIVTIIKQHVFKSNMYPCSLAFLSTELACSLAVFPYTPSSFENHLNSDFYIYLLVNVLH